MNINEVITFIKRLYNADSVQLHAPVFIGNEKKYLAECIDTSYVSSVGAFVDRFEKDMAEYTGAKRAVVCVNGTNGIAIALKLAGVEMNDEVITQPLTFIATANAISYCYAHPVFLDVDKETMGLSPVKMVEWLKEHALIKNNECFNKQTGRRIKACLPMHTFGHPVKLDELVQVCNDWKLELVEDAAESIGSFYKGQHTGTFGKIGVISFNGNKTITTGGGGILLFQDEKLGSYAKHITTQAKIPHRWEFKHDAIGYNYRMPNINAALGCAQLENLDVFLKNKRETAMRYKAFFEGSDITFFDEPNSTHSNFWLNAVICENKAKQQEFLTATNDACVMTRPIWELMNHLPMFKDCECGDLTNAEWFAERVVNIPSGVRIDCIK
jgi:hypothetical protein